MAIRRDDWLLVGDTSFARRLAEASRRFERGEAATVGQVRAVYRRAALGIGQDVARATPGSLRQGHLVALGRVLERRTRELTPLVLEALQGGIRLSVDQGVGGLQQLAFHYLDEAFERATVKALFADVNERALVALLARTGPDGLTLSDRVWRLGQRWRSSVQRLVEDGVARGLDARRLGREVQRYLQPGVWTALKDETRRRLKMPRDVSMEAARLAVTETQNAYHEGTVLASRAMPSYEGIYWRLSSSHPLPDVCDDYAAHNGNGFWPAGEEPSKPHPWCRCVAIPAHEAPEEFAGRLRAWMRDPSSQPELEAWYNGNARRFLRRPSRLFYPGPGGLGGGAGPGGPGGPPAGGGGGKHPTDGLIEELAASGRTATAEELVQIREHVAQAGFPSAPTRVGGRAVGIGWRGQVLASSSRLPGDEAHYVRHVLAAKEWPEGTTLEAYLESVRTIVTDPAARIALTDYQGSLQASFLRESGKLRGPGGHDWILVEYRPTVGKIVTAYQPEPNPLKKLDERVVRWLTEKPW